MAFIWETTGGRTKRSDSEMEDGGTCSIYMGYLVGFKIIWGSFGALVSKWPVSRKRLLDE